MHLNVMFSNEADLKNFQVKANGATTKYNFRFADDWVILTSSKEQAERLKHELTKYFMHKLKLELSQEKTYVTDLRTKGI